MNQRIQALKLQYVRNNEVLEMFDAERMTALNVGDTATYDYYTRRYGTLKDQTEQIRKALKKGGGE